MPISQIVTNSIANGAVIAADLAAGAALNNLGTSQLADANMAPGSVIQVVSFSTSTYVGIASTTQVSTGLSASITPSSSSNRILICMSISEIRSPGNVAANMNLFRNGSSIAGVCKELSYFSPANTTTLGMAWSFQYLDSPNTTSSTTYDLRAGKLLNNAGDLQIMPNGGSLSFIILMEISA